MAEMSLVTGKNHCATSLALAVVDTTDLLITFRVLVKKDNFVRTYTLACCFKALVEIALSFSTKTKT